MSVEIPLQALGNWRVLFGSDVTNASDDSESEPDRAHAGYSVHSVGRCHRVRIGPIVSFVFDPMSGPNIQNCIF